MTTRETVVDGMLAVSAVTAFGPKETLNDPHHLNDGAVGPVLVTLSLSVVLSHARGHDFFVQQVPCRECVANAHIRLALYFMSHV